MKFLTVILMLFAGIAAAQDRTEADKYGGRLAQCYASTKTSAKLDCVGYVSEACMDGETDGETTVGMVRCAAGETQVWDDFLNDEYRKTMAMMEQMDADDGSNGFGVRAGRLREAQRAWIAFRDAECALSYAYWGAGSMRSIAGSQCLLELTAERTVKLLQMREIVQ
ncbi:MAG: lysozyme inhibitor LprI family protein [Pseudomonadota bacterium]